MQKTIPVSSKLSDTYFVFSFHFSKIKFTIINTKSICLHIWLFFLDCLSLKYFFYLFQVRPSKFIYNIERILRPYNALRKVRVENVVTHPVFIFMRTRNTSSIWKLSAWTRLWNIECVTLHTFCFKCFLEIIPCLFLFLFLKYLTNFRHVPKYTI